MIVTDFIKNTRLFSPLNDSELKAIVSNIIYKKFEKNEKIFFQGDSGDSFYLIFKGSVKVSKVSAGGKEITITILYPGDSFGEMSLFENTERSADVTALQVTETMQLTRESLLACIKTTPEIALKMLSVMSEKLRKTNGHIESLSFSTLKQRLIRFIISYNYSTDHKNCGHSITLPYSQREIAELLGVNRESITRLFSEMKKSGLIRTDNRKITTGDIRLLQEFAEDKNQ